MSDRAWLAGLGIAGLTAGLAANPDRPIPFPVCAFKYFTGWDCPLCGLTRSVCHALHGHWAQSWHYHPAGILVAAGLVGGIGLTLCTEIKDRIA